MQAPSIAPLSMLRPSGCLLRCYNPHVDPTPLVYWLQGLALGITAASAPGPLQAYIVHQSLTGGWRRSFPVAFAPLISDLPIVAVILLLLTRLPDWFLRGIGLLGGMFSLYLAYGMWRAWRAPQPEAGDSPPAGANKPWRSLRQAVLLNVFSPGPYTFWTLVNGPLLLAALSVSWLHAAGFVAAFYAAFIASNLLLVGLFHQARRLGPGVTRGLSAASALILTFFGLLLVWQAIRGA